MPRCFREGKEEDRNCCACRVEWAMWGNINALYAGVIIFAGSVLAASIPDILISDSFPTNAGSVIRYINIVVGIFIILVEYPRSARRSKKRTSERPGQRFITPVLNLLGFLASNYIIRFAVHLVLVIPTFFVLPTIFGGMCLFFASICYFVAAVNGESWKAPTIGWGPRKTKVETGKKVKEIPPAPNEPPPRPPTEPPPRPPPQ